MIQKEKLAQFYFIQYRECAKRTKKKSNSGRKTYFEKMSRLLEELARARTGRVSQAHLEEYHRQIKNVAYYAFKENNQVAIMKIRDIMMEELVRLDIGSLKNDERELVTAKFLGFLREEDTFEICQKSLRSILKQYMNVELRGQIIDMVPTRPETEFPRALEMSRHFILHIGPTNCGKTYQALEKLRQAENGVYLGPLRLLALEVYEKMKDFGIPCTMLTGEECIYEEGSRIVSSTVEMLDLDQEYDVAVIDEAQMIADSDRGHSWTRAVLGVRAGEIHVCMSPAAEEVICHLISLCGDTVEVHRYERKTRLLCEDEPFSFPEDVREGDALIVFTKRMVLDIAGRLERSGKRVSVIYGSLPPEIRRRQIRIFSEGETHIVVSTDAIGMGLNLPVRRIVFIQTEKFDGKSTRPLKTAEILQIAGRAGRYGYYDVGYVQSALDVEYIGKKLEEPLQPLTKARTGFPEVLLDIDMELDEIIEAWEGTKNLAFYDKISMTESVKKYRYLKNYRRKLSYMEDRKFVLSLITCPFDVKDREVLRLWLWYCEKPTEDHNCPMLPQDFTLEGLESYYKQLDLYTQFSGRMNWEIDREEVAVNREWAQSVIGEMLEDDKGQFEKKCRGCGVVLPWDYDYPICQECYHSGVKDDRVRRSMHRYPHDRSRR